MMSNPASTISRTAIGASCPTRLPRNTPGKIRAFVNRNNFAMGPRRAGWFMASSRGLRAAQEAIARQVGCQVEEIALTRSGSESLRMLIVNLHQGYQAPGMRWCTVIWTTRR